MAKRIIKGRLAFDPELKENKKGEKYVNATIYEADNTQRDPKNQKSYISAPHRIFAKGELAEELAKMHKGEVVTVIGANRIREEEVKKPMKDEKGRYVKDEDGKVIEQTVSEKRTFINVEHIDFSNDLANQFTALCGHIIKGNINDFKDILEKIKAGIGDEGAKDAPDIDKEDVDYEDVVDEEMEYEDDYDVSDPGKSFE